MIKMRDSPASAPFEYGSQQRSHIEGSVSEPSCEECMDLLTTLECPFDFRMPRCKIEKEITFVGFQWISQIGDDNDVSPLGALVAFGAPVVGPEKRCIRGLVKLR